MPDQVKYNQKLKDKKILIVGGSSGIGFGLSEALLENGSHVIVSSSQQKRVDDAIARLKSAYPSAAERISGHAYDMGTASTLEQNVVSLLEQCGKLDHIVWTAGGAHMMRPLSETTVQSAVDAGTTRYYGPLMIGKHAPKYLNPGPESSIVLTTGFTSEKPLPGWAPTTGHATGLHGLNRALALDLRPLRVNLISLGAVVTELWDGMPSAQKQGFLKSVAEKSATGVVGKVEDVVEAYLYVIKDRNVTGSVISTNSGVLLM